MNDPAITARLADRFGREVAWVRPHLFRRRGYLALHPAAPQHPHLDLLVLAVWSVVHRQQVHRRRAWVMPVKPCRTSSSASHDR